MDYLIDSLNWTRGIDIKIESVGKNVGKPFSSKLMNVSYLLHFAFEVFRVALKVENHCLCKRLN